MCSYRRPHVGDVFVAEHGAQLWSPTVYHAVAQKDFNKLVLVWHEPDGWHGLDWHPGANKWHVIDDDHKDHVNLYQAKDEYDDPEDD